MDEFLKKLGVKNSSALIGHSLGGAIAWELATAHHDTKRLVIMDAFLNYTGRTMFSMILSVAKDKLSDIFEEWHHVRVNTNLPVLALWGKNDTIVPFSDYSSILNQSGVKLVTFPGGHYWFGWHEGKMMKEIDKFINS